MILLTIMFLTCGFVERGNSITKCPRVCQCNKDKAVCGKHQHGLTRIPSVPAYIKSFVLINGNITTINRLVLSPISNCTLLSLTLCNDGIKILSDDSFADFQELEHIDLSGNSIPVSQLKEGFRSVGNHLQTITLSNMNIRNIPMDLFETRKIQNLTYVNLSQNNLKFLKENVFAMMPSLLKLNVSYNKLKFLSSWKLTRQLNITKLNLGNNKFEKVPKFCWVNGTTRYSNLKNLNIEHNDISSIDKMSFECLENLRKLTISENEITVLPNNSFINMPRLDSLHLISLTKLKKIDEFAFNSSITILHLSKCNIIGSRTFSGNFPFSSATKLRELYLQRTHLDLNQNQLREMILQLKAIQILNLQRTQIHRIPPKTLCYLSSLSKLDLQGNYLKEWDRKTFSNVTQLQDLNLSGNRISLINETSFPYEMRSNLKRLNIGNNDFLCTCALLWFRMWMKDVIRNKTVSFVNYPHRYYCKNPTHLRLDRFNPTEESCIILSPYVIAGAATGTFVILVMAVIVLIYRNRWNIRYCFYSRRRRQYQRIPGRNVQMKYNAFVSCDSDDMDWMMDEVATFLEDELELRLCIHQRDFEGAKMIIDNIMDCMEQSEKIILIISNKFARSKWCQCELKFAINEHFETEQPLVVIIREVVYRKNMTPSLKALFETTTYIQWEEDDNARKVFKCRMADVMGCEYSIN